MSLPCSFSSSCLLASLLVVTLSACSPSLSPLYRDYEVQAETRPVEERIERALSETGWKTVSASTPNAVSTEERKVSSWVIYRVFVSLEVVPIGDEYVRLYFHPYRKYFTGGRSKIPYLNKSLRRSLLRDLNAAFREQGLIAIGTGIDRDKEAAAR
ncbi:MAG: hypothetical protein ACE5G0_07260 [Rhodothermales bacterium]